MALKSFHEYLNSKGGIPAPIKDTGKAGDHVEKGKGKGPGGDGSKAPKKGKVGDDWTKLGGKDLVTKFDSDGSTKTFKKDTIRTAESFAHYQLLPLIREAIEKNPILTEDVVHELKRNGMLGLLVGELLEHKETFRQIAHVMAHDTYGPTVCRKLVRAMREEAAPPFAKTLSLSPGGEEDDQINRDTQDGEGVDDDELNPDDMNNPAIEDPDIQDQPPPDPNDPNADPNNPPDPNDPNGQVPPPAPGAELDPKTTNPAMRNFQRAMMSRY